MNIEELISDLRNYSSSAIPIAANKLEELQRDLKQAIAEKIPPGYGLLNDQIKHLKEQAGYMQHALSHEIADGKKARDEVNALKQELAETIRERNKTVADLIKRRDEVMACRQFSQQITAIRPEPSRLEIAAMMLAALASRESGTWEAKQEAIWAIEQAGELIALAKEVK